MGRKRKAPVDLEAEAEEHQKRREVQYQSLLAPATQSSPLATAISSSGMVDNSYPQFSLPSLPDVQATPTPTPSEPVAAPSFDDATRTLSEMENMGYDQARIETGKKFRPFWKDINEKFISLSIRLWLILN